METRRLGRGGATVSALSLGTWAMGGDEWGDSDDETSLAVLRAATAEGITLIDTADVYGAGHSEELIGDVIPADWPGIIVTKVGWDIYSVPRVVGGSRRVYDRDYIEHAFAESCRRLRRSVLDAYLLHNPTRQDLVEGGGLAVLRSLQDSGLVRLVGASVGGVDDALAAIEQGVDILEVPINAARPELVRVLQPAQANGVAVIAREPLERGLLTGKYDLETTFAPGDHRNEKPIEWRKSGLDAARRLRSIAEEKSCSLLEAAIGYPLSYAHVSTTVVGARSVAQLDENVRSSGVRLDDEQRALLEGGGG
jgi:aryl-alcohol dehydrogenase-like predicted oxidoreductase